MDLRAHLRRLRGECGGAALVEFTLVAPMLIGLMCGLAEFGQALRQYHVMEKGVRDAARYLTHIPADPCAPSADWPSSVASAKNLAVYGAASGGTALYSGWNDVSTVSVAVASCGVLNNPRGPNAPTLVQVTVTATAPYVDLGMLSFLGLGSISLTASHRELKVS